jgi:hypothetical protein
MVIMDFPFPGFLPPEFEDNGPWWFAFDQTPNLPEALVEGTPGAMRAGFEYFRAFAIDDSKTKKQQPMAR